MASFGMALRCQNIVKRVQGHIYDNVDLD